jgi:hypothetical protein
MATYFGSIDFSVDDENTLRDAREKVQAWLDNAPEGVIAGIEWIEEEEEEDE